MTTQQINNRKTARIGLSISELSNWLLSIAKGASEMKKGQLVSYTIWGKEQCGRIVRTNATGTILFLDNGKWMHSISCRRVTLNCQCASANQ